MPQNQTQPQNTTLAQAVTGMGTRRSRCTPAQLAELLEAPFATVPGVPQCPVRDLPLADLPLTQRASRTLGGLEIRTVGQLLAMPVETLIAQWSFGQRSLRQLQDLLTALVLTPDRGVPRVACDSFDAMVRSLIRRAAPNPRIATILQHRLAANGKAMTLAALGDRFDITRERVRQLEAVGLAAISTAPARLASGTFWKEAWSILKTWARPCPLERIATGLQRRMGWADPPDLDALGRVLALHPDLLVSNTGEVSFKN